ncbi:MAG: tRNA dihydrouridine synthase DusB [Deltaproteobacteria bacterium]|nr:tRNA dihydrouridine synthase DusB [Deltaproteobacteria bacterium]
MFYIGKYLIKSPYLLAPMAGVSEMPFRVIALEMGAGLATTELISAKGIVHQNERTQRYLKHDPKIEYPFSVQLFGGEERSMIEAALYAAKTGAHIIDINMGCPVKKVTKTGAGSALLGDQKRVYSLVKNMTQALGPEIPVTVKVRTGWDSENINCIDLGKVLEDAGCAALAIHGRTRAQGYSGKANWEIIQKLKQSVQIPIIGNGDIATPKDAQKRLQESGCDAVMIGRGALGNPWIFRELAGGLKATPQEKCQIVLRHFEEHLEINLLKAFRSHLAWYSKGIQNSGAFREKIMRLDQKEAVKEAISTFFLEQSQIAENETTDFVDYRQAFG